MDTEKEGRLVISPPELFTETPHHPHIPLPITPGRRVPGCSCEGSSASYGHYGPCCVHLGIPDAQHSTTHIC